MDTEYEESMSTSTTQNNGNVSEDPLINQIDRLRHQLSAQIGRTDQVIVDRNKTVLQIQEFYEKALHNKQMSLKEQIEVNCNLNDRLKTLEETLLNERKALKQFLHKEFTEILHQLIQSSISYSFVTEIENNSFRQIRNSFSTLIFKFLIDLVLESEESDVKRNKEIQIQRLNERLIEALNRVSDGLQVTHRIAYKGFTDQRERPERGSKIYYTILYCLSLTI